MKKITPVHIIIKFFKTSVNEKKNFLSRGEKKANIIYTETKSRVAVMSEIIQAKSRRATSLKYSKRKIINIEFYTQQKYF